SPGQTLESMMLPGRCPACGHGVAAPFWDAGAQPLATLAFPQSADEAQNLPRYRLRFVRCVDCGHVYNTEFDYSQVPYSKHPNRMFNQGPLWRKHLEYVRELLLGILPARPTVVEIGCGDGHLLSALAGARPEGRYIGFDPNAAIQTDDGRIEARVELFVPERHLAECRPHLLVARHVLEHLVDPLQFLQAIALAVSWTRRPTRLFVEMPCIDQALETGRTTDFFYEHNSHFTTLSLRRMLERAGAKIELLEKGYGGEVVFALALLPVQARQVQLAEEALRFAQQAEGRRQALARQLEALVRSGVRVAIWGGTGKAAALINQCGLDAQRFPLVVDSDIQKAGTYVPGTGQLIRFRDYLKDHPVDVILIAPQWRAADIVLEIQQQGIPCRTVLIEYQGRWVDYFLDDHPYRPAGTSSSGVAAEETKQPVHPAIPAPNFWTSSPLPMPSEALDLLSAPPSVSPPIGKGETDIPNSPDSTGVWE
ncbi:MAG TPA: methyltransferase domain-containing protein, partial [Thermoguttaceae bacterium]|nr:methyltransferase domain-containing protein [Thermoguttaceae bacterium]